MGRRVVDPGESKRARFVRIAESRTNKVIRMIKLLGNCSVRSAYEYDEEDVRSIFMAIEKELRIARMKFSGSGEKETSFSLRDTQ